MHEQTLKSRPRCPRKHFLERLMHELRYKAHEVHRCIPQNANPARWKESSRGPRHVVAARNARTTKSDLEIEMISPAQSSENRARGYRVLCKFAWGVVSVTLLAACSDAPSAPQQSRADQPPSASVTSTPLSVTIPTGYWGDGTGSYYVCPGRTFYIQATVNGGVPPYFVEWYLPIASPMLYRETTYSTYPMYSGMTNYPRGSSGDISVTVRDSTGAGASAHGTMVVNPNPC
jgi:hypothetical protein